MNDIGKLGGLLDARDPLHEGPIRLITSPELSPNNRDNLLTSMTAGTTFVGQFIDRVESGGLFEDLPRTSGNTAIIADPRNDENLMIAGLHAAFLLAHNRTVDFRRAGNLAGDVWFHARRTIIHYYQWIMVNEFSRRSAGGPWSTTSCATALRWYRFSRPAMPVEFQTGVFRMGHSLVRPSYRANLLGDRDAGGAPAPFFGFVFDPAGENQSDPVDLRGRRRARRRFIGWQTFFDFGGDSAGTRPSTCGRTSASTPAFPPPVPASPAGHRER